MNRFRRASWTTLLAAVLSLTGAAVAPVGGAAAATPATSTLVAVRAAHHTGYDRIVFEFTGPVPANRSAAYVPQVVSDPSGQPVQLAGSAFLRVRFSPAQGHDDAGRLTYGPTRATYALPEIIQYANAGDFEGTLAFGVGVARSEPVKMTTLTGPSRVVLDIPATFRTVQVKDYFQDRDRFNAGTEPFVRAVSRPVIPPALAAGALQRLFAGPTQAERAAGLRFAASHATGYRNLSIADGVARVTLTGGCGSDGSTFTVADEIVPTLKQFGTVGWVKIYDPAGHTELPTGHTDSIPTCLEP